MLCCVNYTSITKETKPKTTKHPKPTYNPGFLKGFGNGRGGVTWGQAWIKWRSHLGPGAVWVTAREAVGRSSNDRWGVLSHHRVPTGCVPSPFSSPPTDSLPLVAESPLGTDRIILSLAEGPIPIHVMLGVGGLVSLGLCSQVPLSAHKERCRAVCGGHLLSPLLVTEEQDCTREGASHHQAFLGPLGDLHPHHST